MVRVATTGRSRYGHTMFRFTNFTMMIYVIFLNAIAARAAKFERSTNDASHSAANGVSKVPYSTPAQYAVMAHIYGEFKFGHWADGKERVYHYNSRDENIIEQAKVLFDNHGLKGYELLEARMFNMSDGMYADSRINSAFKTMLIWTNLTSLLFPIPFGFQWFGILQKCLSD